MCVLCVSARTVQVLGQTKFKYVMQNCDQSNLAVGMQMQFGKLKFSMHITLPYAEFPDISSSKGIEQL